MNYSTMAAGQQMQGNPAPRVSAPMGLPVQPAQPSPVSPEAVSMLRAPAPQATMGQPQPMGLSKPMPLGLPGAPSPKPGGKSAGSASYPAGGGKGGKPPQQAFSPQPVRPQQDFR